MKSKDTVANKTERGNEIYINFSSHPSLRHSMFFFLLPPPSPSISLISLLPYIYSLASLTPRFRSRERERERYQGLISSLRGRYLRILFGTNLELWRERERERARLREIVESLRLRYALTRGNYRFPYRWRKTATFAPRVVNNNSFPLRESTRSDVKTRV